MTKFQRLPGEAACASGCRQCGFGYHCSPCSRAHIAAKKRRHGLAYIKRKRQMTEAEYAAALPGRMQNIADQLSELLPEGMRFEWDC